MACGVRTDHLLNETVVNALLCAVAAILALAAACTAARLREAIGAGGLRQKAASLARRLASSPLAALVDTRRVQRAEFIFHWGLALLAPLLALSAHEGYWRLKQLCTTPKRYEPWPNWPADVDKCHHKSTMLFADSELVPLTLFSLYFAFVVVTGVRLTGRILDMSNAAFLLFWMLRGMLQDTLLYGEIAGNCVHWSELWVPLAILGQTLTFGNFPFLATCPLLTSFEHGLVICIHCDAGTGHWSRFTKLDVVQLFSILLLTWYVDSSNRAECRKTLEAADSTNAATLASRLLAGFCDAVVDLGPDLDIKKQH